MYGESQISIIFNAVLTGASVFIAIAANNLTKESSERQFQQEIENRFSNARSTYLVLRESNYGRNGDENSVKMGELFLTNMLYQYEDICKKYFDRRNDKEWFKKNYGDEIKRLIEDENIKKEYAPGTAFTATMKFYNEVHQ